jgi:sodium/potassium/calcium exchanger 6
LIFGLDENVAGVTFLAFGNGSPDLFATFAAMRANSGSLAIGELLGAASFIISVVAGSMCIVRPFRVNPRPFFRDVGFFTVAVSGLLFILIDGVIRAWEAACLAGLYLLYVLAVASSWWGKRREETQRRIDAARNQFAPDEPELEPYHDEEPYQDITRKLLLFYLVRSSLIPFLPIASESSTLQVPQESRPRAVSNPVPPKLRRPAPTPAQMSQSLRLEIPPEQIESARNSPHSATAHHHLPSFSLMGALEFRSVVTSFQRESSISSLDVFNTPISPYAGGHYDRPRFDSHSRRSASSRSRTHSTHSLALDTRPHSAVLNGSRDGSLIPIHDEPRKPSLPPIPRLSIQPPEYFTSEPSSSPDTIRPPWGPSSPRLSAFMSSVARTLFPTLRGLGSKTFVGKLVSFLAAPAVLLLTLTLPVVVTERHDAVEESASQITVTAFDDEEAEERAELAIEAEVEKADEWHPHDFNKYLIASQCALGPLFCVGVLFGGTPQAVWWLISTAIVGISSSVLVLVFADDGKDSATRLGRCLMGFVVSMVWIMAIADEVVQVLTVRIAPSNSEP